MELIERTIQVPSQTTKVRVYFSYDWHNGAYGCDHDKLESDLRAVESDEWGFLILGGDLNESIPKKDRRHDSSAIHPRYADDARNKNLIGAQENYTEGLVKPLKDKTLANIIGNHEKKYALETDKNFTMSLSQKFDIPFGGGNCVIVLKFKRSTSASTRTFLINAVHGKRGGGTTAGKVTALERQSKIIEGCHCYVRGHGHKRVLVPDEHVEMGWNRDGSAKLVNRSVLKGSSGAYLRILEPGGSCYAEDAEYQPTDLGMIYAEIQPFAPGGSKNSEKMNAELRMML